MTKLTFGVPQESEGKIEWKLCGAPYLSLD